MSILIDKNSRVMTQGITGKTGMFHTLNSKNYANGIYGCFIFKKGVIAPDAG